MFPRLVIRLVPVIVVGALALAAPVSAQDRYGFEYDHYRQDRHEAQHHRADDRRGAVGHALDDLFRYGTTDRYSSPNHYYRDQRRGAEHYFRDQDRAWDHDRRNRWSGYASDDYYRSDRYYRDNDNGHARNGRDHRR